MAEIATGEKEPAESAGKGAAKQGCGFVAILVIAVALLLKGCWGNGGSNEAESKATGSSPSDRLSVSPSAAESGEPKKFYLITSLLPKPFRYHTWAYEIMPSGSVKFINLTTKRETVVSQPFTIEEKLAGKGW